MERQEMRLAAPLAAIMVLLASAWFSVCAARPARQLLHAGAATASACFDASVSTSLKDAVRCYSHGHNVDGFVIGPDDIGSSPDYDPSSYFPAGNLGWYANSVAGYDAWPDMTAMATNMLNAQGTGVLPAVPAGLASLYDMKAFTDATTHRSYWVAVEKTLDVGGHNKYGWGIIIVDQSTCCRPLLFGAPHTKFDTNSEIMAADIMARVGGCYAIIAGAHRAAYSAASSCQATAAYGKTDVAHDPSFPFHMLARTVYDWEDAKYGCTADLDRQTCQHLQIHGKGVTSCPTLAAFLSSGVSSSSTNDFYTGGTNPGRASRINALSSNLQAAITASGLGALSPPPPTGVATPAQDGCSLTGGTNIFSRWLAAGHPATRTGVSECAASSPSKSTITGFFLHAEIANELRQWPFADAYSPATWNKTVDAWASALQATFAVSPARCPAPTTSACGWSGVRYSGQLVPGDATMSSKLKSASNTQCSTTITSAMRATQTASVFYRAFPIHASSPSAAVCLTITANAGTTTNAAIFSAASGTPYVSLSGSSTNLRGRSTAAGAANSFQAKIPAGHRWQLLVHSDRQTGSATHKYDYTISGC